MLTRLRYLSLSILLTLPVVSMASVMQGATISSTLTSTAYPGVNFWDPGLSTPDTVAISTVVNDEFGSGLYDNPEFAVPFGGSGSTGAALDILGNPDPNDPLALLAFGLVSDGEDLNGWPFLFNMTFSGVNNGLSLIDVIVAEQTLEIDSFLFTADSLTINVSAQEFAPSGSFDIFDRGILLVMTFGDVETSVPVVGTPLLLMLGLLMWRRRPGVARRTLPGVPHSMDSSHAPLRIRKSQKKISLSGGSRLLSSMAVLFLLANPLAHAGPWLGATVESSFTLSGQSPNYWDDSGSTAAGVPIAALVDETGASFQNNEFSTTFQAGSTVMADFRSNSGNTDGTLTIGFTPTAAFTVSDTMNFHFEFLDMINNYGAVFASVFENSGMSVAMSYTPDSVTVVIGPHSFAANSPLGLNYVQVYMDFVEGAGSGNTSGSGSGGSIPLPGTLLLLAAGSVFIRRRKFVGFSRQTNTVPQCTV